MGCCPVEANDGSRSTIAYSERQQRWSIVSSAHCRQCLGHREWHDEPERGSSLLGILSVVATLGILAVIVLTLNLGSSPSSVGTTVPGSSQTTTTTGPQNIASEQQAAQRSACQANFTVIITAVADYRSLNGSNPPAGIAWATSTSAGGPFIQAWPSGAPAYALTWNGTTLSVVPVKGRASHGSIGTSSPATGCFA